MNSREWEDYEANAQEYENRLDLEARFREPTDEEIRAELLRRATESGVTVEQLISNGPNGTPSHSDNR